MKQNDQLNKNKFFFQGKQLLNTKLLLKLVIALIFVVSATKLYAQSKKLPAPNILVAPLLDKGPVINGKPFGDAWEKANWGGNLVFINQNKISDELKGKVGVLWTKEALYVGFRMQLNRLPQVVDGSFNGDDGLERDDAVEVTLSIPGFVEQKKDKKVVQFKLNCKGLRDDGINFDFSWNAKWQGAVTQSGRSWYATFRLPFANFNTTPRIGTIWGANFGAFLKGFKYRAFLWNPAFGRHHHRSGLGKLVFGSERVPGSSVGEIKTKLNKLIVRGQYKGENGIVRVLVLPDKKQGKGKAVMQDSFLIANFDKDGKFAVAQISKVLAKSGDFEVELVDIPTGRYWIKTIILDRYNKPVNIDVKPYTVESSIAMKVRRYPVAGSANLIMQVFDLGRKRAIPTGAKVVVTNPAGKMVYSKTFKLPENIGQVVQLSLGKLKNDSKYEVTATAFNANKSISKKHTIKFYLPPRPKWADTQAGKFTGKVPAPWTKMTLTNQHLKAFKKELNFRDSVLFNKVTANGFTIVNQPVSVMVSGDKGSEKFDKLSQANMKLIDNGIFANYSGHYKGKLCNYSISSRIEFDGFLTVKVRVEPLTPLKQFSMTIPLAKNVSTFMRPLPGASNRDRAGNIPNAGIAMDRVNNLWISGPDAGLYFGMESFQSWTAPKGKAIEITKHGKSRNLTFNFYKDSKPFTTPREYEFLLQIAPIKPYANPNFTNGPILHGLQWGYNVTPLEDDVVKRIELKKGELKKGDTLKIKLHNYNDLAKIAKVKFNHWCANEKVLEIRHNNISLVVQYSQPEKTIVLKTPWGTILGPQPFNWQPSGDHTLSITWGDKLEFQVDGKNFGAIKYPGVPKIASTIELGSVSSRFRLDGLTLGGKVLCQTPLELRSRARTLLSTAKEAGAEAVMFFEHWCTAQNGGKSRYEPILKNMVEDAHAADLKIIFYFGFEIADVPEHKDMIEECKALAEQSPNFYSPAKQNTYWVSYGGPYQEYLLYNMNRLKKELKIDGVYLDGALGLRKADNPAFGAGYTDKNGDRVTTVPIKRIRKFAQRIHNLFIPDGGIVFAHIGMSPPTVGYISCAYLGEHVGFLNIPWKSVDDLIPPEVAINLYAGKNTGIPLKLCIQNMWPHLRGVRKRWYKKTSAWADINRICINVLLENPICKDGKRELTKLNKFKKFGVNKAKWHPWWELYKKLKSSHPDVLRCSAFVKPDGDMILSVYNSGKKDIKNGWIDLKPLLGKTNKKAKNILNNRAIELNNSIIKVKTRKYEGFTTVIE
jgi:glycosyl hydrolase family 123